MTECEGPLKVLNYTKNTNEARGIDFAKGKS